MKAILLTVLISISTLFIQAQNLTTDNYSSIKTFLIDFKSNAKNGDRDKLSEMVEHYEIEDKKVHEIIIDKAIENKESLGSDFAYSEKAMQVIIDELINEFEPLSDKVRNILNKNDEFHKIINQLPNDKIAMLNHNKTHIILTLQNSKVKLLFWENMNGLIQ